MTTNKDHALKIMNAQYTKITVENVLTDLKELYETSLIVKAAMSANAVSHYAGPLSAPFDIESPSTAIVEPKSLITIGGLAKLHKAINSLHLVVDQQNKIINPDQEPVSPVDELRRQVAEVAKGNAPGSVTQTVSRYKLVSSPDNAAYPESVNLSTKEVFETEARKLEAVRGLGQVEVLPELRKVCDEVSDEMSFLRRIYDAAVAQRNMVLSFDEWLIHKRGLDENSNKEGKKEELVVTPSEPSGALPKVVPIHDGPAPPKNNMELLVSPESPLCEIFSPGPWFHEGRGTVTVGSTGFSYYKDVDPVSKDPATRSQLPNGFYGNDGNDRPTHVLLRMKTSMLLWNFDLDPEHMEVFIVGLSDTTPDESPRWFMVASLGASWTSRLMNDLNAYLRELNK